MDEVQSTLDGLKETMPSETYLKLCEATKRAHEEEEPLFEVAYTATTVTALYMDVGEDSHIDNHNHLMFANTQHTKIMRIGGQYTTASFEKGLLYAARRITDDVLEPIIKPGDQLVKQIYTSNADGFSHSNQSMNVLYTIISIKQYKPKRTRTESPSPPLTPRR